MSHKVIIIQSNYIPWKGYFDLIRRANTLVLYDEMQFTKQDWRNRNQIKTDRGLKWLSIPVKVKGRLTQKINQTEVADQSWRASHWESLRRHYGEAPFFSDYAPIFEMLYARETSLLSDINREFIEAICGVLQIDTEIRWSRDFKLVEGKTEKLVGICRDLSATHYITGPAAKNYMETDLFEQAGIEIIWADYSGYPEYPQLYEGFEHAVTILDLIFNMGPRAIEFMKTNVDGSSATTSATA